MDSFELDVKKGLYNVNDDIIVTKAENNQFIVYLIDYQAKQLFRYEVLKDFELEVNNEIYIYEYLIFKAISGDFTKLEFMSCELLSEYVKIKILNEYTVEDFCDPPKNVKTLLLINKIMTFIKGNIYDFLKLICVLSIISIFNYFINNKAIFMLNSIYGESMKPTLSHYSAGVVVYPYHLNYGDLIACRKNVDGSKMNVLKRIIALPGDHVEIIDDYVYINGQLIDEPYIQTNYRTNNHQTISFEKILEKTRIHEDLSLKGDYYSKTIPANYYFVLGDNRKDSYDSRNFGLVHYDEIVGEYIFTLLSI